MAVSYILFMFLRHLYFNMRNKNNLKAEQYDTQNNTLLLVRQ
jgi:hypothetical protein